MKSGFGSARSRRIQRSRGTKPRKSSSSGGPINSLDDIMMRDAGSTREKIRKSLNSNLNQVFDRETLKSHLSSTISASAAAAITHRLPPGLSITGKQLLELARQHGGFKRIIPTDGDFEKFESSPVVAEDNKVGMGMGSMYRKALVLTEGVKHDAQMRLASTLYKPQTWPCFNSQSSKYYGDFDVFKVLQSSAGANRQGTWFPKDLSPNGLVWDSASLTQYNGYMNPLLLKVQWYEELRKYLISDEVITWLGQEENNSSDLFYAVNSTTSIVEFSNADLYLPINLKIYICKCKKRTRFAPAADWFVPSGTTTQIYNRMSEKYVYKSPAATSKESPGGGTAQDLFSETSVHLGATPFYSPTFRENWEVVDLVKQTIESTDKFQLTVHREFRNAHSIRDLEEGRDTISQGFYQPGDYAMLITFAGSPCIMKYQGTTSQPFDLKEVDASPVKLVMTSRSSINISAPDLYTTANAPTSRPSNGNYISGEGRVLDVTLDNHAYSDSSWLPSVITNVEQETGGSR